MLVDQDVPRDGSSAGRLWPSVAIIVVHVDGHDAVVSRRWHSGILRSRHPRQRPFPRSTFVFPGAGAIRLGLADRKAAQGLDWKYLMRKTIVWGVGASAVFEGDAIRSSSGFPDEGLSVDGKWTEDVIAGATLSKAPSTV